MSRRGFLAPDRVRRIAFWLVTMCIVAATFVAILAIWQFAGAEVMWRSFATCGVIAGGTLVFVWVNEALGERDP